MKFRISFAVFACALALPLTAQAEGDAEKGEKVFKKCSICHEVGPEAKNKVGPILNNVLGRKAGEGGDFKYSPAMIEAGEKGIVWSDENLHQYLEKPRDFIPKNKMAFVGLKKESDRDDVVAYLKQFSPEKK